MPDKPHKQGRQTTLWKSDDRILANVYLHYVLDQWFERDVKPRMRSEAYLIRCADDFIVGFELESDAVRYQTVLPKRLARFSLSVAEDKAKLIRFGCFARRECQRRGEGAPQTFDFLGFTHYCGTSRAGRFQLKRKTSTKKLRMKLLELNRWFWKQLETPIGEMWHTLNAKLRGHYQYYGINDNWPLPTPDCHLTEHSWPANFQRFRPAPSG